MSEPSKDAHGKSPLQSSRHAKRRSAVFRAVADVLDEEERDWASALKERPDAAARFECVFGVRIAAELTIGYLAMKRLLTRGLLEDAFLWPEFALDNLGRVDLWIGDGDGRRGAGLAIELKPVTGSTERKTLRRQSERLFKHERVDAAGLVVWHHDHLPLDAEFPELTLAGAPAGWTQWRQLERIVFPAVFESKPARCGVALWGAERQ